MAIFNLSTNYGNSPISDLILKLNNITNFSPLMFEHQGTYKNLLLQLLLSQLKTFGRNVLLNIQGIAAQQIIDQINPFQEEDDFSSAMGNIFSQGVSTAVDSGISNVLKGQSFTQGMGKDVLGSISGAGAGLVGNLLGKGFSSLGGNNAIARGVGQGIATGVGTVGGLILGNLAKTGSVGKLFAVGGANGKNLLKSVGGSVNPYALGASVLGSALGAGLGASKEYAGKYGSITLRMDTAYDVATTAANFIPGVGQGVSAIMTLNKGLSNLFGSTSGMTKTDAILGSAFMPAPVKWLNMWGASTTGNFRNLSWQNTEKTNTFMQDAFGNLGSKFDRAREEAGKTYGTFSQGAKRDAQRNIDYANAAWNKVLGMADQNELQNIRSQAMSSINNQRYALMILGGFKPLAIGKLGMKIFNNATNHNIGMRLLSGAALIDNKQMILCSVQD